MYIDDMLSLLSHFFNPFHSGFQLGGTLANSEDTKAKFHQDLQS